MKVAELITKLQAMPPDADVETEGCDCIGQAEGVRLDVDGSVLITRTMDEGDRARRNLLYPSSPIEIEIAEDNIELAEGV